MHGSIIYSRHFSFSWLKASSSNNDASVDVEKSQLAAMRSEMAMFDFESSGKRGRGLELVRMQILAKYPAVTSRRRKSVFRRWRRSYARQYDRD